MRRRLILTVAAAVSMVLLALVVPLAVLLRSYALEDRLTRAALEVQATETVVSAGDNLGAVAAYVEAVNALDDTAVTSVLYPDGTVIGPDVGPDAGPEERARIAHARSTGTARLDDVAGGTVLLVPVSLGPSSAAPEQTPVVRVLVRTPGLQGPLVRAWLLLGALALVLLLGALVLADRLGRSFVTPVSRLAGYARTLGTGESVAAAPPPPDGPEEVRDLGEAVHRLVGRIETLLERERAGLADLSHRLRTPVTALRLRVAALEDPAERDRLDADLDALQAEVDAVVREARRVEREGLVPRADAVAVVRERVAYWSALAEDQGRVLDLEVAVATAPVATTPADLAALVDVLLDNLFTHTPEDAAGLVRVESRDGVPVLTVADGGPGFAPDVVDPTRRGRSGAGSTGLGLAIVRRTAEELGGTVTLGRPAAG
ncbi:sensor histidine kinase [Nocardioides sp.]|uniref:sensor histidine kinase n=1 Tax=Nocardioides sp. TaxID=35761 RepID=UPI003516E735